MFKILVFKSNLIKSAARVNHGSLLSLMPHTNCNVHNKNNHSFLSWKRKSQYSYLGNRPLSMYQYSDMTPRLSGQISIFGVVFIESKSLLTRKPQSHVGLSLYRTWPIVCVHFTGNAEIFKTIVDRYK